MEELLCERCLAAVGGEDVYYDRYNEVLCLDCLKSLHRIDGTVASKPFFIPINTNTVSENNNKRRVL